MKNSGIEWIGEIPDSWQLIKIGSIFACRNEKVSDSEFSPLSVSRGGVVPQMENVAKSDAGDNRKLVLKNDFVINSRSDRKQSCGVSSLDGSVSLINTVLYPIAANVIIPEYANVVMKNYGFAEEFYRWGHGIVADLWTTRWQEMKSIVLPLPTIDTQVCIIKDLSQKLTEVDKLIEVQQAQIEKLKEYKQSVITEAVTKGLDPTAPMKDSGVEWIGKIPEGWMMPKIKYFSSVESGGTPDRTHFEYWNGTINWFKTGELHNNEIFCSEEKITEKAIDKTAAKIFPENTILVAMYGQGKTRGMTALLKKESATNQACAGIQLIKDGFIVEYLWWTLMGAYNSLRERASGSGQPNLSVSLISEFEIPMPSIEEQEKIIVYLKDKCAKIDKLIALKQSKIEKLQEYKKSLIYEYVTGKKEVM